MNNKYCLVLFRKKRKEKIEMEKNKHLTYENRQYLENGLSKNIRYTEIAKNLNKDRRTIIREIQKHKVKKVPSSFNNSGNLCKNKLKCKRFDCRKENMECYEEEICERIKRAPYVCNGCEEKIKCRKIKYYYSSKIANQEYEEKLVNSREGINLSKSEVYELDQLISPLLIEKKQTISHIYASHPDEIRFSRTSMYKYIELGIFRARNIDLPRKVRYKKRKNTKEEKIRREKQIRKNRTYEDFKEYIGKNPDCSIVEMDTVEGIKGGKVILTMFFRKAKFMLIYLMENKTEECVEKAIDELKETLGIEEYKKIVQVILTDNGSEFFNPVSIEVDKETGEIVTQVFYCDPCASWQKGAIEKNHEYIRYILPKGTSFDNLTQEEINIIASNINSTSRDSLNGKTPYEVMQNITNEENMNKLGITKIEADNVNLSQKLLKDSNTK